MHQSATKLSVSIPLNRRQLAKYPTESKRLKVANLQSELQLMIAEAKSDYESSLASNYAHRNNNKIFQYISSIKSRESFPAKMCYNDEYASTDLDKAQLFNKYFYSVFSSSTNTTANIPDSQLNKQSNNQRYLLL